VDFFDACRVLIRRWYVVLPLLVVTVLVTVAAYSAAASNYTASGQIVLIAPTGNSDLTRVDGEPIPNCELNQWCNTGGIASLGNITARSMLDETVSDAILNPYPGASYEVGLDDDDRSPIITMEVTAASASDALTVLDEVRAGVETGLSTRQVGTAVPLNALITSDEVTRSTEAKVQAGGKLRAAVAAFGLGLAVVLGGAFLAESIARSRAVRAETLLDRIALSDGTGEPPARAAAVGATRARPASAPDPETKPETHASASKSASAAKPGKTAEPGSTKETSSSPSSDAKTPSAPTRRSGRVGP